MKPGAPLISALVMTMAGGGLAADWPQWRGPNRDGKSADTALLKEWPKDGPPLAWRTDSLGGGYSAPSIAAGRVFGMSNRRGQEVVWALSATDGKELWATPLGPAYQGGGPQGNEGPACTPTVDGELLYVVSLGGDLACLQVRDGKVVWQRSFTRDFGGRVPMWRFTESPLVDGDKVICTPGAQDGLLAALDKLTGKTVWKSQAPSGGAGGPGDAGGAPGPGGFGRGRGGPGGFPGGLGGSGAAYASAIAVDFDGQRQYVQLTARALIGVAAADGKFLWRYDRPANRMAINCSTPIYHDGMVFAASAYGAGGGLVKLSEDAGGGVRAEEVYSTINMQNHHGGMILHDGCLYGANGGNEGGALACLDFKTGRVLWDRRAEEGRRGKGSLAYADGRLYFRLESGTVVLIEPSAKQYVERGRFEQPDRTRSPAWSHPVIADGKLYIRDQSLLLCYDISAK